MFSANFMTWDMKKTDLTQFLKTKRICMHRYKSCRFDSLKVILNEQTKYDIADYFFSNGDRPDFGFGCLDMVSAFRLSI
jgi:hypothetical protein